MKESHKLQPNAETAFNENFQKLLDSDIFTLIVKNSEITSGKHALTIDMGFQGYPEIVLGICRTRNERSELKPRNVQITFDGFILTIKNHGTHFRGFIPSNEENRNLVLGRAIRNSFDCR